MGLRLTAHVAVRRPRSGPASRRDGSFIIFRAGHLAIDLSLQHVARPEHQHAARQDRHFLTGLRIAADATPLLADRKRPEPTDLDGFAIFEPAGDPIQNVSSKSADSFRDRPTCV